MIKYFYLNIALKISIEEEAATCNKILETNSFGRLKIVEGVDRLL